MKDIHEIRPPVTVGVNPVVFQIILLCIGGLLMCLLIWFFVRYLKKRRQRQTVGEFLLLPPPPPPHESALRELDSLQDIMLQEPRLFYFRITAIMRTYIGKVFDLNAPEMTTTEIVSALNGLSMEREMLSSARAFFLSASMIKYAGKIPSLQKIRGDDAFVRRFIETFVSEK